jgi:hypothetical protein
MDWKALLNAEHFF